MKHKDTLGRFVRSVQPPRPVHMSAITTYIVQQLFAPFEAFSQEEFWALMLNTRGELVYEVMASRGTVDATMVHPTIVYREAIRLNASAVIATHNHPSGCPDPSEADVMMTRRLRQAGEIIGIPMVDHIIVGDGTWYSMQEHTDDPNPYGVSG